MSVFAIMVLSGPGVGCLAGGWIEQNPHLGWRWIQWIHVMYVLTPSSQTVPISLRPSFPSSLQVR